MLAKYWKRICFLILLIACLFNIIHKIVIKTGTQDELEASVQYMQGQEEQKNGENK